MKSLVFKLKRLKQIVAEWEKGMKRRSGQELESLEKDIQLIFLQSLTVILSEEDTLPIIVLKI